MATDLTLSKSEIRVDSPLPRGGNSIPYSRLHGYSRAWLETTSESPPEQHRYARRPANIEACRAAAREQVAVQRNWTELASILENSSRHYGVPERILERLELLAKGKALAVVTGQQVGYLGGPLFTFLKAYHATRLASQLEQELGQPVFPIFWLEGEDHDFAEVRHAHFINAEGEPQTATYTPSREVEYQSVGLYQIDERSVVDGIAPQLAHTDPHALELFRRAYSHGTLSDGMGSFIASTLGPRGMLVVEGMNTGLKKLALPLWEKIVRRGSALNDMLATRSLELEAVGYPTPIHPTPESFLFYVLDSHHCRFAILLNGQVVCDEMNRRFNTSELLAFLQGEPHRMSPKASLRPLYQDFVLPTIAYVAGPGEMSYHTQLAPFYRELGVVPPSLFPRLSVTMLDRKTARTIEKLGLNIEQLLIEPEQQLRKLLLEQADETGAEQQFAAARQEIQAVFDHLKALAASIDPTLEGLAATSTGKSLQPLEQLREKTARAIKQKHSTLLSRLDKSHTALKPLGKPAERYFSSFYYFARYGQEQLLAALDSLPLEPMQHHVITLD